MESSGHRGILAHKGIVAHRELREPGAQKARRDL